MACVCGQYIDPGKCMYVRLISGCDRFTVASMSIFATNRARHTCDCGVKLSRADDIGMTKRQTTAIHRKPPQTTTNHRKPPHTTANHHKSPPEFGTIIRRYDRVPLKNGQTTTNHRKLPQTTTRIWDYRHSRAGEKQVSS